MENISGQWVVIFARTQGCLPMNFSFNQVSLFRLKTSSFKLILSESQAGDIRSRTPTSVGGDGDQLVYWDESRFLFSIAHACKNVYDSGGKPNS